MKKAISILIIAGMLSSTAVSAQAQTVPAEALGQTEGTLTERNGDTEEASADDDIIENNGESSDNGTDTVDLTDKDEPKRESDEIGDENGTEKIESEQLEAAEKNEDFNENEESSTESGESENYEEEKLSLFDISKYGIALQAVSPLPDDLCGTEGTGIYADFDGSFDSGTQGWNRIYRGAASWSNAYDHTGSGGSLKAEAKTYGLGYGKTDFGVVKGISSTELKPGKTYKVTAWIYGERVKPQTTGLSNDQNNASSAYIRIVTDDRPFPENTLGSDSAVRLVQGEWVKVETFFVAQGKTRTMQIKFPSYYDDKNYPKDYDIYYVDDITIEEQTNANVLYYTPNYDDSNNKMTMANTRAYTRLNRALVIKNKFSELDVSGTKTVLNKGEGTEVKLFKVDGAQGTIAGDVKKTACDMSFVTAESDNKDVAYYDNGRIVANNYGSTVIKLTYNDGDVNSSKKLLVKVISDSSEYADISEISDMAEITDPMDSENLINVGTTLNYVNGGTVRNNTGIAADKRLVISYRSFFSGGDGDAARMGNVQIYAGSKNWLVAGGGGVICYVQGTSMGQTRPTFGAGWINVDYIFVPNGDGTSNIEIYVNGELANSAKKCCTFVKR